MNLKDYIGKYVIVRSMNEGINSGFVKDLGIGFVVIKDARRLWYHRPADESVSWYEGVATTGISEDSKISNAVSEKMICEDYSLTLCTNVARKSLIKKESHGQN